MIKKILVANRGEIAVRVMRSCREMEITSIAIFSEADRTAKHVLYADEAYCVGPAASKESYLNIEKIIEVAKAAHADAIHPGYGFLSENATFARRCQEEGIIFIGPNPETMEAMGDKIAARIKMIEAGVPVVPGTQDNLKSVEEAIELCNKIGYPVMLKASMGGGGKGMPSSTVPKKWKKHIPLPRANHCLPLAMTRFTWRSSLKSLITSSSRFLETSMEMSFICANANVPCNAVTRKSWKRLLRFSSLPNCEKTWVKKR